MLDHLDDLASDFSAIHGITDIGELSGPAFLKLAFRIASYQGVMRDTVTAMAAEQQQSQGGFGAAGQTVGGSQMELRSAPEFGQIFSFG